jgi:hypothetical protein
MAPREWGLFRFEHLPNRASRPWRSARRVSAANALTNVEIDSNVQNGTEDGFPLIQNELLSWVPKRHRERSNEVLPGVRKLTDASIKAERNRGENNTCDDFCQAVSL